MNIGMVGLGKMGANLVRRLRRGGHRCYVYDLNRDNVSAVVNEGVVPCRSIEDLACQMATPRVVWVMVPAGEPTEQAIGQLRKSLSAGDIVVDGGNSFFKDDVRRASSLAERGILFADVGTSGGIWGLERGYCLMVGGETDVFERL